MRVTVTGGSGVVGRYVLAELATHGHEVTVLDLVPPPAGPYRYVQGDVLSLSDLMWALEGAEGVIHLAAIPNPLHDPPERVFAVNVQGTYNALEAAVRCGVRRFIFASSDSALGFAFRLRDIVPDYLPLDEAHPLRPQDAYGLSKAVGEDLCAAFVGRADLKAVCVRICGVWFPERAEDYRALLADPASRWRGLWVYVDARDAARAFRLALETANGDPWEAVFIAATDAAAREETLALVDRFYPTIPRVDRAALADHRSVISTAKARALLGYRAQHNWRDYGL